MICVWEIPPEQTEEEGDEGKQAGQTSVEASYLWDRWTAQPVNQDT